MNDGLEKNKYLIAFSCFLKFGSARIKKIRKKFENFENAWHANSKEFCQTGIDEKLVQEFFIFKNKINLNFILNLLQTENIKITHPGEKYYPTLLKEVYDKPEILYYKGNLENLNEYNLAVVGSRKYTDYGARVIHSIIPKLIENNINIVSGLALGIDSIAHQTTIASKGKTIAVLGTGIDFKSIYPSSNKHLADKIIAAGGIIFSEFPPMTPPLKHHFPLRNRIVSGISMGTLVVEAAEKSGALITGKIALDQNREVFSVPGNIFSEQSSGTNSLIKEGAKMVTTYKDILESLNLTDLNKTIENRKVLPQSKEESLILSLLSQEPKHINEIIKQSNLETGKVSGVLIMLEMKNLVRNIGNMMYVKT